MDGFFLVDKPQNMTSQNVVNKIKRKFNLKKCGHNGTLDPDTTGLMIVGCDNATKLMKFINIHDKVYQAKIIFGYDSDTLDISGNIINDINMIITEEELDLALKKLASETEQIPPLTSAIKINGKKLYEYQRKNETVEVPVRKIEIYDLKKLSKLNLVNNHYEIDIFIHCSKGFYVRSFARDLGKMLGGCAILKELRRLKSGEFDVSEATPLDELTIDNLISIKDLFPNFASIEVNDYIAKLVFNGVELDERQIITDKPFYVLNKNAIIAIYEVVGVNKYKPVVIFK